MLEFLAWLEGEEERLPQIDRVRKVKDADFAAAIRAAEWLAQHFSEPDVISPHLPEPWLARYELLEQYLQAALGTSLFYHSNSLSKDLAKLERVLEALLPLNFWSPYREDIRHLRKKGLPLTFADHRAKPSGGTKPTEQTVRMRAAVEYISGVSKQTRFGDLARFWNERLGTDKYRPEQIRDRLRKGPPLSLGKGGAERALDHWKRVYQGDLRAAFPGPFPLTPKMRDLFRYSSQ